MGKLLTKNDIDLLVRMYEEASHASWSEIHYMSREKRFDFNFHYFSNDIAVILNLFEGVSFHSTGIMYVSELANPVHHALARLDGCSLPEEAKLAREERKLMVRLLKSPLPTAIEYLSHESFDPADYRGRLQMGTTRTPVRPGNLSHIALVAAWRVKIGK